MNRVDGGQYRAWLGTHGVKSEHFSAHEHALRLFESMGGCTREAMQSFIRFEAESGKEAARIRNLKAAAKHILLFQDEQKPTRTHKQPEFDQAPISLPPIRSTRKADVELVLELDLFPLSSPSPQLQPSSADGLDLRTDRIARGTMSAHEDVAFRPERVARETLQDARVSQYQVGDVCGCAAPPSLYFDEVPLTLVGSAASFLGIIGFIFLGFWLFLLIEASVLLLVSSAALFFSRWKCLECNEAIALKDLDANNYIELRNARRKYAALAIGAAVVVFYAYRGWSSSFTASSPALEHILEQKEQVNQKWRDEVQKQNDLNTWQPGDVEEGEFE